MTKDYKQRITDHQRLQLVYELKSRGLMAARKRSIYSFAEAVFRQEQACVSSIGTSVCRKMISGGTCINYAG
ncbi:endonuclease [Escherichia phage 500465-1]|uniref:endonuclease n=1 Tax=Escherichia phage 500465-1 TaxID=2716351 RepID=UPI0018AD2D3E|nr:endonuclease [Escherichia phage 500465-1]